MDEVDPISVIEAAYRMGVSDKTWMKGILKVVRPEWDDGLGVGMFEVASTTRGVRALAPLPSTATSRRSSSRPRWG